MIISVNKSTLPCPYCSKDLENPLYDFCPHCGRSTKDIRFKCQHAEYGFGEPVRCGLPRAATFPETLDHTRDKTDKQDR